jgi:hypothetical protein
METMETNETPAAASPRRRISRGVFVGAIVGLVALLLLGATAVTAHVNAKRLDAAPMTWWHVSMSGATGTPGAGGSGGPGRAGRPPGPPGPGGMGPGQRGLPGIQGVITAVDPNAKTITIAGVPGVTTVTVDANVKLSARQADGTTKDAAITDFKAGQVVQVRGTIDRIQFQPGQRPDPSKIKLTVTELVADASGIVRGGGIVTAVTGNAFTVNAMGGLTLTVTPASGAKITKADKSAGGAGDIHVGDRISFQGTQQGATVSASDIRVMGGGFGPFGGFRRP